MVVPESPVGGGPRDLSSFTMDGMHSPVTISCDLTTDSDMAQLSMEIEKERSVPSLSALWPWDLEWVLGGSRNASGKTNITRGQISWRA